MHDSSNRGTPVRVREDEEAVNKRIRPTTATSVSNPEWLNLDDRVAVELTSEDDDYPIEGALLPDRSTGWRAAAPGSQTICLVFQDPVRLRTIRVVFEEHSQSRTQEFVIRAFAAGSDREVVRQQFTFSPPTTVIEREEYAAALEDVTRLELTIVPAIGGGEAIATLKEWRVA